MNQQEIIDKLKNGWQLTNRGTGWWISGPRKPYTNNEPIQVSEDIIDIMVSNSILQIEIPYTTAKAKLMT